MNDDSLVVGIVIVLFLMSLGLGYSLGKDAGYDRALADIKTITPPPKTTDQQCVAWLFESNMKEAKRKICR